MERMGDILARSATRSVGGLRGTSRRSKAKSSSASPMARSLVGRNRASRGEDAEQAEPDKLPRAECLDKDNDQILELPRHSRLSGRKLAAVQDTPATMAPKSSVMTPIGDIAAALVGHRRTPAAIRVSLPSDENQNQAAKKKPVVSRKSTVAVCPECGGAGYVRMELPLDDPSFGKPVPCECRVREWEERRRQDLRRISSLDPFKDKTFETFNQKIPGVREACEAARRYAEDPHGWLVLRGGYGCGKTHLAAAVANAHLAAGDHVFFSIVPDLLDHLRAAFGPSSEIRYDEMFERVREAGLLVLDDLGAENGTAWATEKLFQIINYRYNFRMPTVITTNNRLLSHMDERLASRLSDIGLVRTIVIEAPDYRKRHANGATAGTRSAPGTTRGRTQV